MLTSQSKMFQHQSYERHGEWYNKHFPDRMAKVDFFKRKQSAGTRTVAHWLQSLFFDCLNPLLKGENKEWLTIGDAYGFDAQYLLKNGCRAMATDLNSDFLEVARQNGIVDQCRAENAEALSFGDQTFDYVLCKESYHHFPRPYAALYEMVRVSRKGIVIIEPQDPISKMPLLLFFNNLFSSSKSLADKVWKNRFSFEPVGNFVYKVSEREFEKFAAGLNLPLVAFKKINPNFYVASVEQMSADGRNKAFLWIKAKKKLLDVMVKLKIIPGQVLAAIVFKQVPDAGALASLKAEGYHLVYIPDNPYLR